MENTSENTSKLLLHACCGPCSMEPVRLMRECGVEPVVYFANSNIHPSEEYARRLETLQAWAHDERLGVIEGPYAPDAWEAVVGRIGDAVYAKFGVVIHEPEPAEQARRARCRACYRMRFEETARFAATHGFAAIGTTLSVSPYQYIDIIREELERAAAQAGVAARFVDYRPYYDEATRRSREAGMYRQNYCACRFSEEEARIEREQRKAARKAAKEAAAAASAKQHEAEDAARIAKCAQRAAYAEKQARKRAILKQLRSQRKQ